MKELQKKVERMWEKEEWNQTDRMIFHEFIEALNSGFIRAAEKEKSNWKVNLWIKKGILIGFRMGELVTMQNFIDKDTYPQRHFSIKHKVRLVPGGSAVRSGAYVGKNVTLMPPMYINVGAYVDDGTMIDSHALVGSCAQIGKRVHLSAGSQIGGVIEPIGASPVIIEDDVFIGGNCGIFEGIIIQERAILASGVNITSSTPVYDAVRDIVLKATKGTPLIIPKNAVLVPGSRKLTVNPDYQIACPIIIKYRDQKTDTSVQLEKAVR